MSAAESVFVEAAGVRLHARVDPKTETSPAARSVVLLHGFTGGIDSMEGVARGLGPTRPVVRVELVGHGESDAPGDERCYAMDACVDQLLAAIRALGLERPHLLGYSMGGRTALSAAVARPDAFASLVLVGATAGIADPAARAERIAADRALADRIERDGLAAFVDHWMALPLFASQKRLGEAALRRARAERMHQREHGLANSLRGMGAGAQTPIFDALDRVEVPVLIVVGEEDTKFRGLADGLAAGIPDARIATLAEAGHAAHLEQPVAFAERVGTFLAAVDAGKTP